MRAPYLHCCPYDSIDGVVLTMYDVRYKLTEQVTEQVWRNFPRDLVFETIIPRREDFAHSYIQGQPAVFANPMSTASLAYLQLANEVINKVHHNHAGAA